MSESWWRNQTINIIIVYQQPSTIHSSNFPHHCTLLHHIVAANAIYGNPTSHTTIFHPFTLKCQSDNGVIHRETLNNMEGGEKLRIISQIVWTYDKQKIYSCSHVRLTTQVQIILKMSPTFPWIPSFFRLSIMVLQLSNEGEKLEYFLCIFQNDWWHYRVGSSQYEVRLKYYNSLDLNWTILFLCAMEDHINSFTNPFTLPVHRIVQLFPHYHQSESSMISAWHVQNTTKEDDA